VASFKYDPFGRRVQKSSATGTGVFAYDGDNLIEQVSASGVAVARYTQGLGIDEPLVRQSRDPKAMQQYNQLLQLLEAEDGQNYLLVAP